MLKHESVHEEDYYPWVVKKRMMTEEKAMFGDERALHLQKTKCRWLSGIYWCHDNPMLMPLK